MYSYKKRSNLKYIIMFSFMSSLLTFIITYFFVGNGSFNNGLNTNIQKVGYTTNEFNNNVQNESNYNATDIFENIMPSIVGISVLNVNESNLFSAASSSLSMESGIIVSSNGYIVTNQHVAGNTNDKVTVTLYNGNSYEGITKWVDKVLDIAIVKINMSNLNSAKLGDSDNLKLGESAYAIGNPLGLDFQRTITSGIISALNRTIKISDENGISYMEDLIQTDASINPGNSGGPLINSNGEVIGINTIKVNEAEGIGFAIPVNTIKYIVNSFVENDQFEEAYLGIFAYDNKLLKYINSDLNIKHGILIANIDKFGPLKNSKIKVGDVLLSIDDVEMTTMVQLRKYLYSKKPLDTVKIKYMRSGNVVEENITLSKKS